MARKRGESTRSRRRDILFADRPSTEVETSREGRASQKATSLPDLEGEILDLGPLEALESEGMAAAEESPQSEPPASPPLPSTPSLSERDQTPESALPPLEGLPKWRGPEELEPAPAESSRPELQVPAGEGSPEERERTTALWGQERLDRLSRDIDRLYAQVQVDVGRNKAIADYCLGLLSEARALLARGRAEGLAKAEFNIEQVRARLLRARASDEAAKRHGARILAWELFWFLVFALVLFNTGQVVEWLKLRKLEGMQGLEVFLPTLTWGGIGGVVAGFYSLPWHISRRDYDSQYNIFYIVQPLMGAVLGGIVFLILNTGFIAVIGQSIGGSASTPSGRTDFTPYLLYLLACLAGFKQNFAYEMLDQVMKTVLGQRPKES